MKLNRRELLTGAIGIAGATALSRICFAAPALVAISPTELAHDPRRPQYHLLPEANWMNDPNAPHLLARQLSHVLPVQPQRRRLGGHALGPCKSPDMVHWSIFRSFFLPRRRTRRRRDVSGDGRFDGDAVAMIYTGVVSVTGERSDNSGWRHSLKESQCLAFGSGKI